MVLEEEGGAQASGDQMRMGLSGLGDRPQSGAGSDDVGEVLG